MDFSLDLDKKKLLDGMVFPVDKPIGWTSFQVVKKIRSAIQKKYGIKKIKVGHAGTLDPLASGLLILCTGRATKTISEIQAQQKTYEGIITLGATTPSYDLETPPDATFSTDHITEDFILKNSKKFIGEISQYPPLFSAVKKDGKRLYEYARKGQHVMTEVRKIFIYGFDIVKIEMPHLTFHVRCSKGTYIRTLAYDFGKALDSGAHLSQLRRTKIGCHNVSDALSPDDLITEILD